MSFESAASANWRVKRTRFTRQLAGKAYPLYPYRTSRCHCNHCHSRGNPAPGVAAGAPSRTGNRVSQ